MHRTPVVSSNIASVGYDAATSMLEIEFSGGSGVYQYQNVPASIYAAFAAADSHGRFFNQYIKGAYPFTRLGAALSGPPLQAVPATVPFQIAGQVESIAPANPGWFAAYQDGAAFTAHPVACWAVVRAADGSSKVEGLTPDRINPNPKDPGKLLGYFFYVPEAAMPSEGEIAASIKGLL